MDATLSGSRRSEPSALSSGESLHALAARLYPIPRSITGPGVRETLEILRGHIPLNVREVPTGTPVFDWVVPKEWHFRTARLTGPDGNVIVDAATQNLQVLNFSTGFRGRIPLAELREHLFSLPDSPERTPYRTSYWSDNWGFCLPHRVVESLAPGTYEVEIDAEHISGTLNWGEVFLPGETDDEVLFSTHCCHPQLANDNVSGLVVMTALAAELAARPRRRFGYRFLFLPATIGSVAWLATSLEQKGRRIRHGLVAAGLGDEGEFHYKKTRNGDAPIDRIVPRALAKLGEQVVVQEFVPFGYDERQFNAPGIRLPVGSLTRTPWGRYPEYHTDADNLEFIRPQALERSLDVFRAVVDEIESVECYRNLLPLGEPMLGRRGLYRAISGSSAGREGELALLWVLNLSDGEQDLHSIADRSDIAYERIREAADLLVTAGVLAAVALPRPD